MGSGPSSGPSKGLVCPGGGPPGHLSGGGGFVRGASGGCPGGTPPGRPGAPDNPPDTCPGPPGHPPDIGHPPRRLAGLWLGPPGHLSEGGWLCPGIVRGGVHLGLGFRMGLGLWGASSGGKPLESPGNLLEAQVPAGPPGGPWRPLELEGFGGLEALEPLEAPGGPWRPLEAPGGPWRPLEAPGGPWRPACGGPQKSY